MPARDPMLSRYGPNGPNTARRHGANDQALSAADLLDFVALCMRSLAGQEGEEQAFLTGLADMIEARMPGEMNGNNRNRPIRLPASGLGRNVSQMTGRDNNQDPYWREQQEEEPESGRPGIDRSPIRRRRIGQDSAMAGAREARQEDSFLGRFPMAAHIRYGSRAY